MTKSEKAISIEMLHQLLILDKETGTMTWKKRDERFFSSGKQTAAHNCAIWNGKFAGKSAMSHKQGMGYLHGGLFNKKFLAHRVVYALHHGKWPDGEAELKRLEADNIHNYHENHGRAA